MVFGKYQIVIFREGKSGSRNLHVYGWMILAILLILCLLAGLNVWLGRQWHRSSGLADELARTEEALKAEERRTLSLAAEISALARDLDRVKRFDSKLRIMMNMDRDPDETGGESADSRAIYLPLHRQELAARKMQDFLSELAESTRLEEVRQQELLLALRENRGVLASLPSIWPVSGFISSSFGTRISPFGRGGQFHKGLDISNRLGTPIIAPADGTVIKAAPDGAYGNSVEIDHGGGIVTKYAHMQRFAVQPGEWVRRGRVLGYIGMTGRTTGPHLHYEVRLNGLPVNPMRYILE